MINERLVQYEHKGTLLEGFLAYDDSNPGPGPAVMISHAWAGRDEFACDKARAMAVLGYTGFALDLYGKDVLGSGPEENTRLMQPLMQDRAMLQARMQASLDTLLSMPEVRPDRVAAMGFCFGGLCVLDLARTGADLCGVISVHGFFSPPANIQAGPVKAKILALHGHDDPMVPIETAVAFGKEMTVAGVDFQLHVFGKTRHAFTNPQADDPGRGTVYNKLADSRSWIIIDDFLKEVLGR
jgi:dienelactone hydrolase